MEEKNCLGWDKEVAAAGAQLNLMLIKSDLVFVY